MRYTLLLFIIIACNSTDPGKIELNLHQKYSRVNEIPLPAEFNRIDVPVNSFGEWLRNVQLKSDKTVYLYNGEKKENQLAQYAVLDVPVGRYDLQQCADAVMRLRAEFLRDAGRESEIAFHAGDGTLMDYSSWKKGYRFMLVNGRISKILKVKADSSYASFEKYLEIVFTYCSSRSLEKELKPVDVNEILPGDVFIRGGSPGHAVIVMDVAIDKNMRRKYLLAQSYMPAQDIHLLRNQSVMGGVVPWYSVTASQKIFTPEWIFLRGELRRF